MKLTKKIKAEIAQFLQSYWDTYMSGDLEKWESFLPDDYKNIGTNQEEIWNSKNEILEYTNEVLDQMVGKAEIRNKKVEIIPYAPYIMTHELGDLYVKTDNGWNYYAPLRLSSLIQRQGSSWLVLHQHGSFPDSKTQKGEAFAVDALKAENLKLQQAVKHRTTELELKNRELTIETALERIRAQAVAMKESSDLLDIVVTMRNEFIKLGHEAHYFWHMMWLQDSYEKAMTSGDGSKIGFVMELPRHIHGDIPLLAKWEKSKKQTVVYTMNVDEAIDYVDKMVALGNFKNIDPQAPSHDDIRHIGGLTFIMARTTHGEIGYSLPGIVKNPPKEDLDILVQFAGAFDLAHRRFLDLQKAEKQARETQIELSLERIRSRVTAMQESSDLFDIVVTMRNEFLSLGHEADYFWHMKWTKDNYEMSMTAEDGGRLGMVITVPKFVHEQIESLYRWEKSKSPYFVLALDGKEAWDYIEKMNTYGKYKLVDPHAPSEEDILHIGGLTFIIARTTHGEIGFSLAGKVENPPNAAIKLLVRFAQVFDLAYKRFEDLKKAEAQARETQIELALEKVRSRTMAMKHSDELAEASFLLDKQVRELGVKTWGCAFNIYGENESNEWFGNEKGVLHNYTVPHKGIFKEYYDRGQKGESLFVQEFSGEACVAHYEYMSTLPIIGDVLKTLKKTNKGFPTYQIDHVVYFKYGYLLFITREFVPDAHDIFKRFAKVFEQTYTRFLDLQKAEEQARESKIEAALERVRSASMAMHKSEEMQIVVDTIYEQLNALNFEMHAVGMSGAMNPKKGYEVWAGGIGLKAPLQIPYSEATKVQRDYNKVLIVRTELFAKTYKGKNKKEYINFLLHNNKFPSFLEKLMVESQAFSTTLATSKNSGMQILRYTEKPYTDSENAILLRFSKVFEQAYIRFMDLHKAEAQAREAQIEMALEKVRSRTMAMQHSEELPEAANVLFTEVQNLGIPAWSCGYNILSEDKKSSTCIMSSEGEIQSPFILPLTQHKSLKPWHKAILNNEQFFAYEQGGKDLKEHYDYMQSLPELKETFQQFKDANIPLPTFQVNHLAKFTNGFLLFITYEKVPEAHDIFQRFSKVFEQTYTRFLDLQKAEAQAKEAKIEAALERVRSRSMAMHQSDELREAGEILFNEITNLGIESITSGYVILEAGENIGWNYMPDPRTGKIMPVAVGVYHKETPIMKSILKNWKQQVPTFVVEMNKKQTIEHQTFIAERSVNFPISAEQLIAVSPKELKLHNFNFEQGYLLIVGGTKLSDEQVDIMRRFTKVFQQTYTRFLDLKRAEAQTREAQIEAALERVRARAMAMHNTDELTDVLCVLFDQFDLLGINPVLTHLTLMDEENETFQLRITTSAENRIVADQYIDINAVEAWKVSFENWKKSNPNAVDCIDYSPEQIPMVWELLSEVMNALPKGHKIYPKDFPNGLYTTQGHFKFGYIGFNHKRRATEEEKSIVERFAKEFGRTYQRFLDLQKAEAQTREAEIEAALERIRSRSMAMHKTNELSEVIVLLFKQLKLLNLVLDTCYIDIFDQKIQAFNIWIGTETAVYPELVNLPYFNHPIHQLNKKARQKNVEFFTFNEDKKSKDLYFKHFFKNAKGIEVPKKRKERIAKGLGMTGSVALGQNSGITIFNYSKIIYTKEENEILTRVNKVFQQTYIRFLDLQKAESQAKEAQIETALEKVRSRTMAMQKGEEVKDVVVLLYKELIALGVTNFVTCGYVEINEKTQKQETWVTNPGGDSLGLFYLPLKGDAVFDARYKAWKKQQTVFHQTVAGKERSKHLEYAITTFNSKEAEEMVLSQFPDPTVFYCFNFSHGYLHLVSGSHLNKEEETLLARFTRVFEQTYARFLDLQKAEEQTREAQINLAVERVRAKALAMHKSEEIIEVVAKLKDEVMSLDIPDVVAATIFLNEGDDKVRMWDLSSLEDADNYSEVPFDVTFKLKKTDPHLYVKRVWENPKNYFVEIQDEKDFKRLMQWLREQNKNEIADEVEDFIEKTQLKRLYHSSKKLNNGKLVIDQLNPPSDEMETILTKMGAAFDLAYKRFEDLKKAEAQTKEAQIEAALEKVRSRSLAMHNPDELQEVVAVVAEKLKELGVIFDAGGVILCTYFPDNKDVVHWIAVDDFSTSGRYFVPYFDNPIFSEAWDSKINGDAYFSKEFPVETKNDFFKQAFENSDYRQMPEDYKQFVLQADSHTLSAAWSKNSAIIIPSLTGAVPSESNAEIIKRFAKVFEQAYIRFMDLKKSEAQAREAQIEAALERVRSRSMAMHKSEELLDVISVVSEQLIALGFRFHHVSFANNNIDETYSFWTSAKGKSQPMRFVVPYKNMVIFNNIITAQKKSSSFLTDILTQKEHNQWHKHLLKNDERANIFSKEENEYILSRGMARSIAINPNIMLILANYASIPYSEEENKIIARFANVFEQAYTRFLDLQKAEAQARESLIETGLERVRSRTLAMQSSEELAETSVVVFQQLLALGIAPNRLFIGIIKENGHKIDAWATNEDGSKLASHFMMKASENKSIKKMLDGWKQQKKSLVIDMKGKELEAYFKYLNEDMKIPFIDGLKQKRRVQTIAYFSGGLIGMAAPEEQPDETIHLLERFASVFNLTYTRFNDLKVAEAQAKKAKEDLINLQLAKKSAEEALSELQLTQTQLIQSEKMASLGELTAGIAHEIQNPLNFVNNFSEVSKELLDEMLEEIENGDMEEVRAIMNDVIQNLEKINHHGKRADGIVKGMLQHSRSSSGTKEPVNINVLADEYLRLAYHGLRAKDKSFNATLVTDFDDSIGSINILPQDIGRVVLNLLTNAFYVVNEKKQSNKNGYEPTVSLTTKKNGKWVSISVKDNGNGIPRHVMEKIFQPFFTTKPTGQGTGLGLSMSYDIVTKGHGGELKVETQEGEGTEFIIKLPI